MEIWEGELEDKQRIRKHREKGVIWERRKGEENDKELRGKWR